MGSLWLDRGDRPITDGELHLVMDAAGSAIQALEVMHRLHGAEGEVTRLAGVIEGVRAVLQSSEEGEAVTALARAAGRQVEAREALVVLARQSDGDAMVARARTTPWAWSATALA